MRFSLDYISIVDRYIKFFIGKIFYIMKCLNPLVIKLNDSSGRFVFKNGQKEYDKGFKPITIVGNLLSVLKLLNSDNYNFINKYFKDNDFKIIPCRKCVNCKKNRSREFSQRAIIECNKSDRDKFNIFLTLTYNDDYDEYYNTNLKNVNGVPTLYKKDLQDFFKRLRESQKNFNDSQIRYIACGEYGEKTFRPHYHIILYNVIFPDDDLQIVSNNNGNKIYTCSYWVDLWKLGNISFSLANDYTIKYLCNYTLKSSKDFKFYKKLKIEPPFLTCSKGFGFDVEELKKQLENNLNVFKFGDSVFEGGMFEYYKNKIKREDFSKYVNKKIQDVPFNRNNDIHLGLDDYKTFITENSVNNKKLKIRKEL